MRKIIFFSLVHLIIGTLCAQKKTSDINSRQQRENNSACVFTGKYDSLKIFSAFPFNKTSLVKLVSFFDFENKGIIRSIGHETKDEDFVVDSVKIDSSSWEIVKILPKDHYLALGSLIFNYSFKGKNTLIEMAKCYMPHHAIVFYDSKGQLFAVIEICFGCRKIQTCPDNFSVGDECSTKLNLYEKFFIQNGIKIE